MQLVLYAQNSKIRLISSIALIKAKVDKLVSNLLLTIISLVNSKTGHSTIKSLDYATQNYVRTILSQ